ncbi:hypothetical protein AYI70_g3562, partial [Smittium culicis]
MVLLWNRCPPNRWALPSLSPTKDSATLCEILVWCTWKSTLLKLLNHGK